MATTPSADALARVLDGDIGDIAIVIGGVEYPLSGDPRRFKTGSVGLYAHGKVPVSIEGEIITLQISCNAVVVGSKNV